MQSDLNGWKLLVAPLSTSNTYPSKTGPSVTPAEPVMPSGQDLPDPSLSGFFFSVLQSDLPSLAHMASLQIGNGTVEEMP